MLKLKWLLLLVNVEVLVYISICVHIYSFSKAPEIETQFLARQILPVKWLNDMEQCLDVWSCKAAIVSSSLRDVRMLVCFNWMTRDPNFLGNLTKRLCRTSKKPLLLMFQAIYF